MRLRRRTAMLEPLAYSITEAAEAAGLGKSTIQEAIKHSELPIIEKNSRVLILAADLLAWLERDRKIRRSDGTASPAPPADNSLSLPLPAPVEVSGPRPRRRGRPPRPVPP
jgi:excisionase family DNA binding protein